MKKKSLFGVIIGVIVLIVVLVGGYFFVNDKMQKEKIMETFSEIEKLTKTGEFNIEELNEKTSTIVSSGKYAKVEKAAKNYAHDLFNKAFEVRTVLKADGPEFVESKKYITETKQKLEQGKTEMLGYIEEGKINSYIEAETNDAYAIDLYRKLLSEDIEMSDADKKEFEESIDKVISMLSTAEEVINFLIENNGKWEVQGEQVMFNSNTLVTQYNELLKKLRTL